MNPILKRTSNLFLTFVAILGLLNIVPIELNITDLLTITATLFFITLTILIITHIQKIEEEFEVFNKENDLNKRLIRVEELLKVIMATKGK